MHYTPAGLQTLAPDIQLLAEREGLTAHRASVDMRIGAMEKRAAAES
jgi:histidinol dehydrogenase